MPSLKQLTNKISILINGSRKAIYTGNTMIDVILKDGTTLNVSDGSTPYYLIITVAMSDIEKTLKAMNKDNLSAVRFDNRPATELTNNSIQLADNGDNTVTLIFNNSTPSDEELMQRRITDLEEAVTALTAEGE